MDRARVNQLVYRFNETHRRRTGPESFNKLLGRVSSLASQSHEYMEYPPPLGQQQQCCYLMKHKNGTIRANSQLTLRFFFSYYYRLISITNLLLSTQYRKKKKSHLQSGVSLTWESSISELLQLKR